ncbi:MULTISPECIES: hypothetical protein [unclassified Streptomyces]|uniref:hypothetical protein n=1 Tax=unclassified Streptomyces TaxID=2593676 RepID=UPI00381A3C5F
MNEFDTVLLEAGLGELHEDHPGLALESSPTITCLAGAQVTWNAAQGVAQGNLALAITG